MKHVPVNILSNGARLALERKDASGEPTMAEIAKSVADLMKTFEEFKAANDQRIVAVEKKGTTDVVLAEKVDRINDEITRQHKELQTKLQEVEKKANRPSIGGDRGDKIEAEVKSFNAQLRGHAQRLSRSLPAEVDAEAYGIYTKAVGTYLQHGKEGMSADEIKSAQIGTDPSGGYLVTPEMDAAIDRVVTSVGAMRSLATVRQIGSASLKKIAQTSGVAFGGWGNERTAPSETATPDLDELEFTPGTCWAAPRATAELLEDASIDVASWLVGEVDLIFDENESSGFISGNGINKPRGLLSYDTVANAAYAWGKIGYVRTAAAAGFAAANPSDRLIDLMHAPKRQYRGGASFLMTDTTLAAIRKFKDGQGNYLWVPGLQGGVVGVLMGKPVVTDDFMDELGANKFPVAYGDFKRGYLIVDRRGTVVLRDPYTAKPYVIFYVTRRVGGGVQNFEAIKLMKCEVDP